MKKVFLFLLALIAVSTVEAVNPPKDQRGNTLPTIDWVGASPCVIDASHGAGAVGCSTGTAIVYGVIASSVAGTNFLVFRDSATANVASSTAAIVYPVGSSFGSNTTQLIRFPVPLKFNNGISANLNTTVQTGGIWTILYRARSSSTPE